MNNELKDCVHCGTLNCRYQDQNYPDFCKTIQLSDENIRLRSLKKIYLEPENYKVAKISSEIETEFYDKYTRVEEIIEFARRLNFKKIGLASCIGLINETRTFAKILKNNDFEIHTTICKIGSMKKN